ncbi:MAG: hypothetical protein EOM19_04335 [Candidatus Moranbacteria bacterium]|nr:hypothetical protein [Candidatus Moranbacteria bacterium]
MKKNKKEWQSVLLWSLVISGLLFFIFQAIFYLRFVVDWENALLLVFVSSVCLWGIILGIVHCKNKIEKDLNRCIPIRRPILIFFLSYFLFGAFLVVLDIVSGSMGEMIIKGSLIYKVMVVIKESFFISSMFVGMPFSTGYLTGFFIRNILKLYRKYFKHNPLPHGCGRN